MRLQLSRLPRWLRDFVPLVLLMGLIFWLSGRPIPVKLDDDSWETVVTNGVHLPVYAALAWLWWRALTPQRRVAGFILLTAFVLTILYGASDELHQRYVPMRDGNLADLLVDAGGALVMVTLLRRLTWLRGFPESLSYDLPERDKTHPNFEVN
jgi:hypothetical protein